MTPEEIVNNIVNNVVSEDDTISAIEAIKQYAKDMCDKQRRLCYLSGMIDVLEIKTAPYPKELS